VLRWLTRGLSVLLVAFVIIMMVGERANPFAVIRDTRGVFLVFPFGVCAGLLLAWRWQRAGGALSLMCLVLFYVIEFAKSGRVPRGPFFLVFALPAVLFLLSGAWVTSPPRPRSPG
jgi:peptidoglycan/LPS O-acetylase OafA/YrhL